MSVWVYVRTGMGFGSYATKSPSTLRGWWRAVLDNGKERQAYLQQTTGTKDSKDAKRIAVDVLAGFRKTLDEAASLLAERPVRTSLSEAEIDRIAEFYYGTVLADDEDFTVEHAEADEDFVRSVIQASIYKLYALGTDSRFNQCESASR